MIKHSIILLLLASLMAGCIGSKKVQLLKAKEDTFVQTADAATFALKTGDYLFVDIQMPIIPNVTAPSTQPATGAAVVFEKQYPVRTNGSVVLPNIGAVQVAGLTLAQAEMTIATKYEKIFRNGVLRVELAFFSFVVLGEVLRPQTFELRRRQVSLPEAIGFAGGFNFEADRRQIQITRRVANTIQVFTVSMADRSLLASKYYYLQPQDIVTVSRLKESFADAQKQPLISTSQLTLSIISSILVIWAFFK